MVAKVFRGFVSQDWQDPNNWSGGTLPATGDYVEVSANADATGVSGTQSLDTLVVDPDVFFSLGSTLQAGEVDLNGALVGGTLDGGLVNVFAGGSLDNGTINNAVVTVNDGGEMNSDTLNGGTLGVQGGFVTGMMLNGGTLDVEGGFVNDLQLNGTTIATSFSLDYLTLSGTVGITPLPSGNPGFVGVTGLLVAADTTELTGGIFDVQGSAVQLTGSQASLTIDANTFLVLDGVQDVLGVGTITNNGVLAFNSGQTVRVDATLVNNANVSIAPGTTLDLRGTETLLGLGNLTTGGQVQISGVLDDSANTVSVSTALLNMLLSTDGATVEGGFLVAGGTALNGATNAVTTLDNVTIKGALEIAGGVVQLSGLTGFVPGTDGTPGSVEVNGGLLYLDNPGNVAGVTVELDSGSLDFSGSSEQDLDLSTVLNVTGDSLLGGNIVVTGEVTVAEGVTLFASDTALAASATVHLGTGATLAGNMAVAGTTTFDGTSGNLELSGTGALSARLSHFQAGDTVQFDGLSGGSLSLAGNVLTVTDGTSTATLTLADGSYAAHDFNLGTNANGQTVLSVNAFQPPPAQPADPLFDAPFYLANNPDVAASTFDPYFHYLTFGAAEGRDPNPLFDDKFYLANNPDVAASGINPLVHFETFGPQEHRNPNPLFDTGYYLATNPDVAASGMNPLLHFETFGTQEGRNPNPLFDTSYYLSHNPDVAAAGVDALQHFEEIGWQEGRNPDALFDTSYYLAHNPDVAAAGIDPLVHYDEFGWKEGRNPSAAFDTNAYLNANPDVRTAGVDPLAHYLTFGPAEGRAIYAVT